MNILCIKDETPIKIKHIGWVTSTDNEDIVLNEIIEVFYKSFLDYSDEAIIPIIEIWERLRYPIDSYEADAIKNFRISENVITEICKNRNH